MITKNDLIKSTSQYRRSFFEIIRIRNSAKPIADLKNFIESLPSGTLSTLNLLHLLKLLNTETDDEETIKFFDLIKKQLNNDWRYNVINSLYHQWCLSHYYNRAHSLISAINEISPRISSLGLSFADDLLSISYFVFSLYGIKHSKFTYLFSAMLGKSIHELLSANFSPQFNNATRIKFLFDTFLGLGVQIGLDFLMSTDNTFLLSYIGGTFLQSLICNCLSAISMTSFCQNKIKNMKTIYPATFSFTQDILKDTVFYLGAVLTNQFYQQFEYKNDCMPPNGSYLLTCDIKGEQYFPQDKKFSNVKMCEFKLNCEKLDGNKKITTLHVQQSLRNCLTYLENCDGQPVVRSENERKCTTIESAKKQANMFAASQDVLIQNTETLCDRPKGSYLDTCDVRGTFFSSQDVKLTNIAMCQYDITCETLTKQQQKTTLHVQSSMRHCLTFFENCNGKLVIRPDNARLCQMPDEALQQSRENKLEL